MTSVLVSLLLTVGACVRSRAALQLEAFANRSSASALQRECRLRGGFVHHLAVLTDGEADLLPIRRDAQRDEKIGHSVQRSRSDEREHRDEHERAAMDRERAHEPGYESDVARAKTLLSFVDLSRDGDTLRRLRAALVRRVSDSHRHLTPGSGLPIFRPYPPGRRSNRISKGVKETGVC